MSTFGTCKLCLTEADLRHSHVIPEFCYKPIYDEKHRGVVGQVGGVPPKYFQKGLREYLLCDGCEERIGKFEKYFSDTWFERKALPNLLQVEVHHIPGIDYKLFKLFHLSILWRSSIASGVFFSKVNLGPHEDRMRRMLLTNDPGPENAYRMSALAIVGDDNQVHFGAITQPVQRKSDENHTLYSLCFGGCEWTYFVTSHSTEKHARIYLRADGTFKVLRTRVLDVHSLYHIIRRLKPSAGGPPDLRGEGQPG